MHGSRGSHLNSAQIRVYPLKTYITLTSRIHNIVVLSTRYTVDPVTLFAATTVFDATPRRTRNCRERRTRAYYIPPHSRPSGFLCVLSISVALSRPSASRANSSSKPLSLYRAPGMRPQLIFLLAADTQGPTSGGAN